jgi:hypothetical protein
MHLPTDDFTESDFTDKLKCSKNWSIIYCKKIFCRLSLCQWSHYRWSDPHPFIAKFLDCSPISTLSLGFSCLFILSPENSDCIQYSDEKFGIYFTLFVYLVFVLEIKFYSKWKFWQTKDIQRVIWYLEKDDVEVEKLS